MEYKKLTIFIVANLFLSVLLACAPPITYKNSHTMDEQKVSKNYVIGKQMSAYVGNPMIQFKDYKVSKHYTEVMEASKSVVIEGGPVQIYIDKGEPLTIVGEMEKDGKKITVLDVPIFRKQITIDETGRPYKDVINTKATSSGVIMVYEFKANPPDVVFLRNTIESIKGTTPGSQNYEILYSGKTDKNINLTYREYTPDDMARTAFMQNLTYEANAKKIRFKNYQIEIISSTSEQIDFRVVEE